MKRIDLATHAFTRSLIGYNRMQVDRQVQDLSDALSRVTEEKVLLSSKISSLETALAESRKREEAYKETVATQRAMTESLRAAAQKEAQLILDTARIKADGILQNANARLARIMAEAADAQKNKTLFEMKLKTIIDDHLRLLSLNRQESESLAAATQKLTGTAPPPAQGGAKTGDIA